MSDGDRVEELQQEMRALEDEGRDLHRRMQALREKLDEAKRERFRRERFQRFAADLERVGQRVPDFGIYVTPKVLSEIEAVMMEPEK